jgi:hypothetical protein
LTNVKVQTYGHDEKDTPLLFSVPPGRRFFYGSEVAVEKGTTFRIPFTEKYGTPLDFKGDVHLPLSGEKRIQNIGLYHFNRAPSEKYQPDGDRLTLNYSGDNVALDQRTRFAMHAITSRDERKIAVASAVTAKDNRRTVDIGALSRLNIMSEPYQSDIGITGLTLSLPVKTLRAEETLFIRVRDPAIPLRVWNQFAIQLKGFDKSFKRLLLTMQFQDLVLTGGDRLWVDIGTVGKTDILLNDKDNPSEIYIPTVASYRAIDQYARKELISAKAQYSKQYEFMPWQFTGRKVSIEAPFCYGGPFDMIMPALAVHRVKPDYFEANFFIRVSGPEFNSGVRIDPKKAPLIELSDPHGAPAWATYMRDFNKKRWAMADWWIKRQNPDGQVGGGWKDDALFGSMGLDDLEKDGNDSLRNMVNCIFDKFELTRLFKDGYCNIYPIDRLHADDIISERYNTIVNNLGVAYPAEREMQAAWRLGKPDQTPVNYNEQIYKSPVNVLNWYWGKDVPDAPYVSKSLDVLTKELQLFSSVFDDYSFYRMTESNVMRDDFEPYGSTAWSGENNIYTYMLGGARGTRVDAHVKIAVMWPSGGGPDVSRAVLHADDHSLNAAVYSFSTELRNLQMRLCRINDGHYRIGLYEDPQGNGKVGAAIWTMEKDLRRFDVVTLPIPPRKPLVIKVEQLTHFTRPGELADLAIDPWDAVWKDNAVTAIIHNLGNSKAENITVQLLDGDKILQKKVIDQIAAPTDFIAKKASVSFTDVPVSKKLKIVIDPENELTEILKENNSAEVDMPGVKHADQLLWDIRQNKF